jgi:hypothetical protein
MATSATLVPGVVGCGAVIVLARSLLTPEA